jgi:UDP-N-acetyl-D-galactosamine dehydrogenase
MKEYGVELKGIEEAKEADCIIVAVAHDEFKNIKFEDIKKMFKNSNNSEKVLIDVKGIYNIQDLKNSGLRYWRL